MVSWTEKPKHIPQSFIVSGQIRRRMAFTEQHSKTARYIQNNSICSIPGEGEVTKIVNTHQSFLFKKGQAVNFTVQQFPP